MLHTKYRGNRSIGSGEIRFLKVFFTVYGRGGHLGNVIELPRTNFRSPYPRRLYVKFGFDRPSGFGEEDVRALWKTDGRRNERMISSPMSLRLSPGELKAFLPAGNFALRTSLF